MAHLLTHVLEVLFHDSYALSVVSQSDVCLGNQFFSPLKMAQSRQVKRFSCNRVADNARCFAVDAPCRLIAIWTVSISSARVYPLQMDQDFVCLLRIVFWISEFEPRQ